MKHRNLAPLLECEDGCREAETSLHVADDRLELSLRGLERHEDAGPLVVIERLPQCIGRVIATSQRSEGLSLGPKGIAQRLGKRRLSRIGERIPQDGQKVKSSEH